MPLVNFTNPLTLLLATILFLLILFLGKETKKSEILIMMLFIFLVILVGHCVELGMTENITEELNRALALSLTVDFLFIFISFISYLWIDEIEAKLKKKKSIDNSLDWFWKKV